MNKDDQAMNITELHEKWMKANAKQTQEIALKIESSNGQNTQRKEIFNLISLNWKKNQRVR